MYRSPIIRVAAILGLLVAVFAGEAHAQPFQVVVIDGLELDDLEEITDVGAVGLLVPGAGPETSRLAASAMLERGVVRNSLRDPIPAGPPRIEVDYIHRRATGGAIRPGPRIALALPSRGDQPNDRRYPVIVIGPGYRGLLQSDSTRIPGLISIADIAPTALGEDERLRSTANDDPIAELRELNERIDEHNSWRSRTTTWLELGVVALAVVSAPAALLGFATLLTANLVLGAVHTPPLAALLILVAATLAGLVLVRLVRSRLVLAGVLAGVIALYLVSFLVDERWVALSPLGPTQNARFYGISNLLETLLLVPALGAAALFARPLPFALVAALSLIAVTGSRFGADGGGAIVLAIGFSVLATLLAGANRRVIAAAAGAGLILVLALIGLDELTGASSHVTRALRGGPSGLASDLADRVTLSWERATDNVSTGASVLIGVAALTMLVVRLVRLRLPVARTALPLAFAAAIATSMIVNDSPKDVILAGLAGYVAVEAFALGRHSAAGRARALVLRAPSGSPSDY